MQHRVCIIASHWNAQVTERLVEGAKRALHERGIPEGAVEVFWVSGSFELPQAAEFIARTGRFAAIVPVGCILQGETIHDKVLADTVAAGIDQVGRSTGVPISFGVITADPMEQAMDRAGESDGNKGGEAARAALELLELRTEVAKLGKSIQSA